jgi:hypothetical protein
MYDQHTDERVNRGHISVFNLVIPIYRTEWVGVCDGKGVTSAMWAGGVG